MNSILANRLRHFVARSVRPFPRVRRVLLSLSGSEKANVAFSNSNQYWQERYQKGGNSGEGSYGYLARYKAEFINKFCADNDVKSTIEFGCGDGNQATMFSMPKFTGVDISENCIENCRKLIKKSDYNFITLDAYLADLSHQPNDLSLSLDVIYHLVEDEIYHQYLDNLFAGSSRFVLIYASDFDSYDPALPHVRHRPLLADIAGRIAGWQFVERTENPFEKPHDSSEYGSFAHFHLFEKIG
jgi:hypothetical protein